MKTRIALLLTLAFFTYTICTGLQKSAAVGLAFTGSTPFIESEMIFPLEFFVKNSGALYGRGYRCVECNRAVERKYRERAKHESSKDTNRIPGEHGAGGNAGRPAAHRGEQPAGAGPKGDQRHGCGSDGQGPGLDQQQPER